MMIQVQENCNVEYSGFRLIGPPVNWGKSWRTKTNREYNQNLLRLFGAPCHLIGPVTAAWRTYDVILEMHHVGNYGEFHTSTSLQCYNKMKIVRMQLLNKLQQNTGRHQTTWKPMRMTQPSMNE
jgi:hypothetical protein